VPDNGDAPRTGELTMVRLMDSAMEVLAERGYHAARVDDIVARANVSHGTFYLYFANKDALVLALARQCATELGSVVSQLGTVAPGPTGRREVRLWLNDFVALYRNYGVVIRSWVEQGDNRELTNLGVESLAEVSEVLIDRVRETHPSDAELRVSALIAVMERFTFLVVNRDLGDESAVLDTAATVIHRSFFAEPV
jgi:AcrR family transcriptional regulator